ncbi:MAG: hypothetical protein CVT98_05595 [Bacteroidetes bacterium HGW-Bacteroidetes-15]|nr:MAG: hypothetical protein CVT98_05595 [Bacteroidetes bacterium HGW-Bacteroidetes-15]
MRVVKLLVIILLIFTNNLLVAQPVEISVQVLQGFSPQAKLYLFNGSDVELVDSTMQSAPGTYYFILKEGYQQGMYRIDVGKNIKLNVIIGEEQFIDVSTVVFAPEDSLKSHKSIENKIYWDYQRKKKQHKQHTWFIESLMGYYSDSVMFYHLLEKELSNQNRMLGIYAKGIVEQHPNLLASKYINLEQRPIVPHLLEGEARIQYLKDTWWEGVDLMDSRLLYSPSLQLRLWNYVELFFSENLDKEEQDEAFINGISRLMSMEMLKELKIFFRNNLVVGFTDTDYQPVLEYLETEQFGTIIPLKKKTPSLCLKTLSKVKVGEKAYDFSLELPNKQKVKLSKIQAKYKLLVFWSTWCPHCIETLPQINDIYESYKDSGLEVIAISIDEEDNLWKRYIKDMNLNWVNIREPISEGSKVLVMYEVNETPKMFLLSKDLEILSRPTTRRQLEVKLKRLTR